MMNRLRTLSALFAVFSGAVNAVAVDFERFEFNDPNGTQLTAAANAVNPANLWFYAEDATTPGDDSTGDISATQSGSYRIETNSAFATGIESRYLNIGNVSTGKVFLTATFAGWDFGTIDTNTEQLRFTMLDDDTGNSGSTVTAQVQIRRNTTTGMMELFGDAIGTAGSFNIANTVSLPATQAGPFTLVLAVDKDVNNFEVFYKNGTSPTQVLGMGGVSRVRDVNSIRMVTANFNTGESDFPPFLVSDAANLDRLVVSSTNPLTDLLTLEVNRDTGAMTLINTSGAAVSGVSSVSLSSVAGALDLSQLAGFSGTLAIGQSVPLDIAPGSAPGLWVRSPIEDIDAQLATAGGVRTLNVDFVGNSGAKWAVGDLNFNGVIDAADYLILTANAETNLSGLSAAAQLNRGDLDGDGENSLLDFIEFKSIYEAANGGGSFARMLATIPEPNSLGLVSAAAMYAVARRRRPARQPALPTGPTPMRPLTLAAVMLTVTLATLPAPASAAILEDFLFSDTLGTTLDEAANSINPANLWVVDPDITDTATNGQGSLRIRNGTTSLESNYLDIANITTGKAWLVVEMAGWSLSTDTTNPANFDSTNLEQVRFAFLNNDNTAAAGSTLSGQFQIERTSSGGVQLIGNTSGTGGTNVPGAYALTNNRSTPFTVALEVDVTDTEQKYSVYYKDGAAGAFTPLGSGSIAPGRDANSIRFAISDSFAGDGEFFDINRVYLTDVDPLGSVTATTLALEVNTLTGGVSIINPTNSPISIDSYRIASGSNLLNAAKWVSLSDQKADAVGTGVGQNWVEAGGAGTDVVSESFLLGESELVAGELVALGSLFAGGAQDLTFQYHDVASGSVVTVTPTYVTAPLRGDYNSDGKVDAADYTRWRDGGALADGNKDGAVNSADYYVWLANYGSAAASAAAVPEPSSLLVLAAACVPRLTSRGRRQR